ncbi:hypothetical protein BJY52DRAFT_899026 [Lactarius psammicola]|nr:hypothetical protein BJY52DRAFT_899026 [Lactarius psammicola]
MVVRRSSLSSPKPRHRQLATIRHFCYYSHLSFHMGPPRSHRRGPKPILPLRSRTTRSSKGKLLSDPDANTQQLTEQLGQLGLYAADTNWRRKLPFSRAL